MSRAMVGLIAGMALGFAGYFGGFEAFLLVLGLGAAGLVVGRLMEGDLGPSDFVRRRDTSWQRPRDDRRQAPREWRR